MPLNAFNHSNTARIQLYSSQITVRHPPMFLIVANLFETSPKYLQSSCLVTNSTQFITICPQTVSKLLSVVFSHSASSPNATKCPQSSQIVPESSQIDANHRRMFSTHQNIAFNLFSDIIECLTPHSFAPESAPIITKWSQHHQKCPFNSLLRSHSASLTSLMSLTFISSSPKLYHNFQNLSPLTF